MESLLSLLKSILMGLLLHLKTEISQKTIVHITESFFAVKKTIQAVFLVFQEKCDPLKIIERTHDTILYSHPFSNANAYLLTTTR